MPRNVEIKDIYSYYYIILSLFTKNRETAETRQ